MPANSDSVTEYLNSINCSFDVIALSETWCKNISVGYFSIEGYNSYHGVHEGRSGGGVALFVKKGIKSNS